MPSPSHITEGLTHLANHWVAVAIMWHVFIAALLAVLLAGWRPSHRIFGLLLILPLFSVALLSGLAGNPFNATAFAAAAIALGAIGARLPTTPVRRSSNLLAGTGLAMIAFGWLYPHFLEGGSVWRYMVAAPTGVVPCPSLAIVVGFTLWADGLGSRAWTAMLVAMGAFYGLLGMFWLGVHLDAGLVIGSAVLATLVARRRMSPTEHGGSGMGGP
jgi:hypothetical protein